jgi:hypothetical protein
MQSNMASKSTQNLNSKFKMSKSSVLLAVQQNYKENNGDSFGLVEGAVIYDSKTKQYVFHPCPELRRLFDLVENTDTSLLMTALASRVEKILLSEIDYE